MSNLDYQAVKCDRLRAIDRHIDNFAFWRDRLVVLKQVFDEAEPSTLSQWWCDRRNEVQWYTFWVAILVLVLTLVFGFVQCIEGALQVYWIILCGLSRRRYEAYRSEMSYQLLIFVFHCSLSFFFLSIHHCFGVLYDSYDRKLSRPPSLYISYFFSAGTSSLYVYHVRELDLQPKKLCSSICYV